MFHRLGCGLLVTVVLSTSAMAQRYWIIPISDLQGNWTEVGTGGYDDGDPAHVGIRGLDGRYWWGQGWDGVRRCYWKINDPTFPAEPRPYIIESFVPAANSSGWVPIEVNIRGDSNAGSDWFREPDIPWKTNDGTNHQYIQRNQGNDGDWVMTGPGPHAPVQTGTADPICGAGVNGSVMWLRRDASLYIKFDFSGFTASVGVSALRITELVEPPVVCDPPPLLGGPVDLRCVGNIDPLLGIGANVADSGDNDRFGADYMIARNNHTFAVSEWLRPCSDQLMTPPNLVPKMTGGLPTAGDGTSAPYVAHLPEGDVEFKLRYNGLNSFKWDLGERRGDTWTVTSASWQDTITVAGANWREKIAVTAARWEDGGRVIRQDNAFTDYVYQSGDRIKLTAGNGVNLGDYEIAEKQDNSKIRLHNDINGGSGDINDNSIQGEITTRYIVKSGAFTNYQHSGGNELNITAGTGITAGAYRIRNRVNNDIIRMENDINGESAGNITDNSINGTIATHILSETGAFANYPHRTGDKINLTAGSGVIAGQYTVRSKVNDNAIQLIEDINGAGGDIAGSITGALSTEPETFYRGNEMVLNEVANQEFIVRPYSKVHLLSTKDGGSNGEVVVTAVYEDSSTQEFSASLYDWFNNDGDAGSIAVGQDGQMRSAGPQINGFRRLSMRDFNTGIDGGQMRRWPVPEPDSGDHDGAFLAVHPFTLDTSKNLVQVRVSVRADGRGFGGNFAVLAVSMDANVCSTPRFDVVGGGVDGLEPDGAVDQRDFGVFQACITGTGNTAAFDAVNCACFDIDQNGYIDGVDLAKFDACWTGPYPGSPAPVGCDYP